MRTSIVKGKDTIEEFKTRIHFPDSVTANERAWLMEQLKEMVKADVAKLFKKLMDGR